MKRDNQAIQQWLEERKLQSLYRSTKIVSSPQQPKMMVDGQMVLSFCSNDYLGLANHPKIIAAFRSAACHYGVGAGASHLVSGHSYEHDQLERELAEFTGRESALLFSSGYMANIGVVSALMDHGDTVFQDRLNHASLLDAGLLSGARLKRYMHNDMDSLLRKLSADDARNSEKNKMLLSDGVFSMDGDLANVAKLVEFSKKYNTWLMIDDAHGFGVLGKTGAGVVEVASADQDDVPLLMATLGKAIGVSGAFVAGSYDHIEFLRQSARTWIYTTAMPSAMAAACRESLRLIQDESWRREKLLELIAVFKQGAQQKGFELLASDTAIQPVLIGDNKSAMKISSQLLKKGFLVTAIRPPTVPKNTARLRITLSASHEKQDVYQLIESLEGCLNGY